MRALTPLLAIVALLGGSFGMPAPETTLLAGIHGCETFSPGPDQGVLVDFDCGTGIRPGASMYSCTLNFVMTDGTDHYIGTAGHCGGVGKTVYSPGVGRVGKVVFREFQANLLDWKDWSLIKVDEGKLGRVDPTMMRWGGPFAPASVPVPDRMDLNVREATPGDLLLQYGHGAGLGREDATKGRALETVATVPGAILAIGEVGGGDSGSPVRFATGEAAGIAVAYTGFLMGDNRGFLPGQCASLGIEDACAVINNACRHSDGACDAPWRPGSAYGLIVISSFYDAMEAFEAHLGHDLWVVSGDRPVHRAL